ncbi:hypothetical protein Cob_v000690 [Colletotrichum orbiculare MAFF 240422]|uniref:Uncharacterized protein n=1 Tax=Colletotrichum orbiculare (strain 104-T / ATCC 96160 / CBS 514.97 / LARS 414 / MAFF 240422) TaxID=1213857 RepID=A0A484G818_COLOR|nr:hypothetical protein Cob_v000690 [Colletotrichum orbiculare MAFF 240422]
MRHGRHRVFISTIKSENQDHPWSSKRDERKNIAERKAQKENLALTLEDALLPLMTARTRHTHTNHSVGLQLPS